MEDSEAGRRGSLLRAVSVILLVSLGLYTLYERATVLQQLERVARDFHAQLLSPRESTPLAVVLISEDDYRALFDSSSPLDRSRLEKLLRAIAKGGPKLIGVDLATDDPRLRGLGSEIGAPIVWARELADCHTLTPKPVRCVESNPWVLLDFAGAEDSGSQSGLVVLRTDPDGVIRRYSRFLKVQDTLLPSFPTAIAEAVRGRVGEPTDREYLTEYRPLPKGSFYPASFVLEASERPGFGERGFLKDRVVMLGGSYRAARDQYRTPLGEKHGVEILAQIAQTELDVKSEGDRVKPIGLDRIGIVLFLNGLVLLFLYQMVSFPRAFWVSLLLIPVLATLCSLLFAKSPFALWPYLVPLQLAVLVQQLYSHAKGYRNALIRSYSKKLTGAIAGSE
ncbi:MAG: CHASE2 domain-containing protein [Vicinamibacteria bacterium]